MAGNVQGSATDTFIDPAQAGFLDFLRGAGQDLAFAQMPVIGDVASQMSGRLGGTGDRLLSILEGAAGGGSGDVIDALIASSGAQPGAGLDLQGLLEPGAQLENQIDFLGDSFQRSLERTLGTLGTESTLMAGTGGDREAFFARELAGDSLRAEGGAIANLVGADLAQRRALAPAIAGIDLERELGGRELSNAALGLAGELGIRDRATSADIAGTGIGSLAPLFNLGLSPFSAGFQPLMALADILGAPTVLSRGRSAGSGFSLGRSDSMARSRSEGEASGDAFGFTVLPSS